MKSISILSAIFFLVAGQGQAFSEQEVARDSSQHEQQSSSSSECVEAVLYEISFTRLQRLATKFFQQHPDSALPTEVIEFLSDVKQLAEEGSFDLAVELLDEVTSFFDSEAEPFENPTEALIDNGSNETLQSSSEWTKYVFVGSDLWEQKFNLALGEQDSTILEGEGNPFVGMRLRLDRATGALSHTQAEIEAKCSRDYLTGTLLLDHRQQLCRTVHTKFENRFEATTYRRDSDLRYIDDKLNLGIFFNINNSNSLEFTHEIQVRDYAHETDLYASFLQNRAIATLSMLPFGMTRIDVDYDYRNRKHGFEPTRDYFEHRIGTDAWYGLASNLSSLVMAQWRARSYVHPESDTLLAKDFSQFYAKVDLRLKLAQSLALYLDGDFEIRGYKEPSTVIPNYWELTLEPSVAVTLGAPCTLRFGYNFKTRRHSAPTNEVQAKVEIENYYAHGPVFTADIFTLGGLVFSLTDNYEFRRYPNSISKGVTDFSLYSDRNVNSLFLFMSWNFSEHWELDVIANLDHDDDTKDDNGDSRTTLFTLELAYRF